MRRSTWKTFFCSLCSALLKSHVAPEILSRSGFSSMKEVVTTPASKTGCERTLSRKGMLVLTPRMRASCSARFMRRTTSSQLPPEAVYLTRSES